MRVLARKFPASPGPSIQKASVACECSFLLRTLAHRGGRPADQSTAGRSSIQHHLRSLHHVTCLPGELLRLTRLCRQPR